MIQSRLWLQVLPSLLTKPLSTALRAYDRHVCTSCLDAGMMWVQAENEDDKVTAEDSATFGAVPLGNVLGRCIYAFSSEADQGFIENSESCKAEDEEVVAIEFTDDVVESLESVKSSLGEPHPGPGPEADSARPKKTP